MGHVNFQAISKQISGILPIDYFFAKEFSQSIESEQSDLWFNLLLALSESVRKGHTCLPISSLDNCLFGFESDKGVVSCHGYQFPSKETIATCLQALHLTEESPVIYHQQCLYMRRNFCFEKELSQYLQQKKQSDSFYDLKSISNVIEQLFPQTNNEIDWQKIAVANSVCKGFSVIAGGPGTGKTYTVTKLLAAIIMLGEQQHEDKVISLVAPTGKAAQRLSESIVNAINGFSGVIDQHILNKIPRVAQTLHRLLKVIPNSVNFKHNQDKPLQIDVIIIDEVSMVDLALMTRLFRALPEHCQVIMLGDADQLPSVALGSVLADVAKRPHQGYSPQNIEFIKKSCLLANNISKQLPKANTHAADHLSLLTKSRRFDGEGAIGKIAMATIMGKSEDSWLFMQKTSAKHSEIYLAKQDDASWKTDYIEQYYRPLLKAGSLEEAFELLSKFRFLCATRVGIHGVSNINEQVIASLKGNGFANKLFQGLPIMVNENHYGLHLFNGDIGLIWPNEQGRLMAYFESNDNNADGEFKAIIPSRLPNIEPVFAMTIHKTQGSEFDHVCLVLPEQSDNQLLSRELVYTGVTRAKKQLTLSCKENVWHSALQAKVQRFSNLII